MPQERCIRPTAVHDRRWEVGEIRTIDQFEDDGTPIVTPHFRLVEDDEKVDPSKVHSQDELREKRREIGQRDKSAAVLKALDSLDPDEARHWTQQGLPSIQEVCLRSDLDLTRSEVNAIAPGFDRKSHREAREAEREARQRASA